MINKETLTVLNEQEVLGKDFRIYGTKENPLFLAKDVAEWIEHSNPRMMLKNIDDEEKVVNNAYTLGGNQETWFLTEYGLYEVLMQSRKPIAKAFKKEVKAILKQIRQTGGYIPVSEEESEATIMAKALEIAHRTLNKKDELILQQQKQLQEQKPKVEYYDAVLDSSKLLTITEIASDLGLSGWQLNKFLSIVGVQNRQYGNWKLSKKYVWLLNEGYADYEIFSTRYGKQNQLLKWTEKGRKFIIDTFYNYENYEQVQYWQYKDFE